MNPKKEPREGAWLGRFRWAAEPYLAFKNDRLRLYALIARDVRKVAIMALVLYFGQYHALAGMDQLAQLARSELPHRPCSGPAWIGPAAAQPTRQGECSRAAPP